MKNTIMIKNYIGSDIKNINLIKDILVKNEKNKLVIGPTGSGKTVAFVLAMQELEKDNINIFMVPNRNQAIQLENDFKHKAIIGGVTEKEFKQSLARGEKIFFCVYDKAYMFRNLIKYEDLHYKYNMVIDEAHCLIQDYFRKEAMTDVLELNELVHSSILTTATPDILINSKHISITDIIEFKREDVNKAFNEMSFINYVKDKNESLHEALYYYILSLDKKYDGIQIRINDKKFIQYFSTYFVKNNEYCLYNVDSSQKDMKGSTFTNVLYDSVVRKSKLPYEKEKVNIYLHTSLLDAGTNISHFEGKKILTIYVLNNYHAYNLDAIAQCLNRIRFSHDCCIFAYDRANNVESIKNYSYIRTVQRKAIKMKAKALNMLLASEIMDLNFELATRWEKEKKVPDYAYDILNQQNLITGKKYSEGCIYYNEEKLCFSIDTIKLENIIYNKYQNQYYFNKDEFIKSLSELFQIEFKETTLSSLKKKYKGKLTSTKKVIDETIKSFDTDDLKDIYENKINSNQKLLSVKNSKIFIDLHSISETNKVLNSKYKFTDLKEVIKKYEEGITFKQQREDIEIGLLKLIIKEYPIDTILEYWKHFEDYENYNSRNLLVQYIKTLKKSSLIKILNEIFYSKDVKIIIISISYIKTKKDLQELIDSTKIETIVTNKKIFNKKPVLDDHRAIFEIIDYFTKDKYNSITKKFKSTTLNEENLKTVHTILTNTCHEKYTDEEIIEVIKRIFICKKEGDKIRIRGFKKNYKGIV